MDAIDHEYTTVPVCPYCGHRQLHNISDRGVTMPLTQGSWRPNTAECERAKTFLIRCADRGSMGGYEGDLSERETEMLRRAALCIEWAQRRANKEKEKP